MEQRKPRLTMVQETNGPRKVKERGPRREEKEFEERVVTINRVTKVVKGGRRIPFCCVSCYRR